MPVESGVQAGRVPTKIVFVFVSVFQSVAELWEHARVRLRVRARQRQRSTFSDCGGEGKKQGERQSKAAG